MRRPEDETARGETAASEDETAEDKRRRVRRGLKRLRAAWLQRSGRCALRGSERRGSGGLDDDDGRGDGGALRGDSRGDDRVRGGCRRQGCGGIHENAGLRRAPGGKAAAGSRRQGSGEICDDAGLRGDAEWRKERPSFVGVFGD
jgi:hypothetical protein